MFHTFKGTSVGRLLEQGVRLDDAGKVVHHYQELVREELEDLQERLAVLSFVPDVDEDLERNAAHVVGDAAVAELPPGALNLITKTFYFAALLKDSAADPNVSVRQSYTTQTRWVRDALGTDEVKEEIPGPLEIVLEPETDPRLAEWKGQYLDSLSNLLSTAATVAALAARALHEAREKVTFEEERLVKYGAKWEETVLGALGSIAGAYTKYRGHRAPDPDADLVWFEGYTTAFGVTGVSLDADELMAIVLQYLEGGPPAAMQALEAYL